MARQGEFYEFQGSLIYIMSLRLASQVRPYLKKAIAIQTQSQVIEKKI